MNPVQVTHNMDSGRFEVSIEGHLAALDYRLRNGRIVFTHTGVPSSLEGRGIGSALARAGLEYASQSDLKVIPLCPFVRSYIDRYQQYQDLVETR